jgi:hypothetical protein
MSLAHGGWLSAGVLMTGAGMMGLDFYSSHELDCWVFLKLYTASCCWAFLFIFIFFYIRSLGG